MQSCPNICLLQTMIPQKAIDYDHEPRAAGTGKRRYWQLWKFAFKGVTGFSIAPLKVQEFCGPAATGPTTKDKGAVEHACDS